MTTHSVTGAAPGGGDGLVLEPGLGSAIVELFAEVEQIQYDALAPKPIRPPVRGLRVEETPGRAGAAMPGYVARLRSRSPALWRASQRGPPAIPGSAEQPG